MISNKMQHNNVIKCITYGKKFLSSRRTYNIKFEFTLNKLGLLNTHIKLSFSMYFQLFPWILTFCH